MSYTLVLEWMPGDLYMSAVTARCTAPTSSYSVVWLPPNKVYQITLYCGSTSLVSFLVGAFRGKAWSYMGTLELQNLTYSYDKKKKVLRGIDARMEAGKMYAILGPSGCGKTTLLSLLGGLDSPTSGAILFEGKDVAQTGLAGHRKKNVSFIFQSYNLIDYMTPQENVRLISKKPAFPFLERLGLTKEETRRNVLKLSGGQQQRVAIARALASEAPVILADEPTGNLDEETAQDITEILKESAHQMNKCVVVVTHSNELAKQADVVFRLKKGELHIEQSGKSS